jgi:cephalosporin hydroxylase
MNLIEQPPGYGPAAPVPILQWEKEFSVLLELYRRFAPWSVLEIGTYHGGTLYHWLQNAAETAMVVSLDSYVTGVDNRHLYESWRRPDVTLHVLEGDSHSPSTVKQIKRYGPYEWIFIDGGHFLPEVTKDWELYRPLVAPGGIVCFHDILLHPAWRSIEVGHLWAEIKREHPTFEIIADPKAEWGGIGVVLL